MELKMQHGILFPMLSVFHKKQERQHTNQQDIDFEPTKEKTALKVSSQIQGRMNPEPSH